MITRVGQTNIQSLFKCLGFKNIATEEQEKQRWAKKLQKHFSQEEQIQKNGIFYDKEEEGWYIYDESLPNGSRSSFTYENGKRQIYFYDEKIEGKELRYFTN